jgi:hypothetical protein
MFVKTKYYSFIMKQALLSLILAAALTSQGQPILTQSNSQPVIGSQIAAISGPFNGSGGISVTGANVVWDFSDLSGNSNAIDIVQPSSTPYAGSVSGANVALDYGTAYDYYNVTSSIFERKASYYMSNYYFNFTNGQSVVEFPCTYETAFTDTYVMNANVVGDMLERTGTMDAIADGYGSLILPWGTIENVLRIRVDETYEDIWNGTDQSSGTQTTYLFFHPGAIYMLLSINLAELSAPTFTYMDESVLAVSESLANDTHPNVYPNPTNDLLNVPMGREDQNAQINVYNSLGQCVFSEKLVNKGYRFVLNTTTFESDIYTLQIINEYSSRVENFVVTR